MKKNAIAFHDSPQFRLAAAGQVRLGKYWDGIRLSDHFWRLYHHDAPGAGLFVGGGRIELLPGRLYLLPPHCDLKTWCEGAPTQLYFHFETTLFAGNSGHPCNGIELTPELRELLDPLRGSISGYHSKNSNTQMLRALALAASAMTRLPPGALTALNPDKRISEICDFLRNNMRNEIDTEALAARAKMPKRSFLRLFSAFTGSSPYQYLLHVRYMHAARLLEAGVLTIDEICETIGVHDRFHFSRMFKSMFGAPPAQYRKRHNP